MARETNKTKQERRRAKPRRRAWLVAVATVILTLLVALSLAILVVPIRESFLGYALELTYAGGRTERLTAFFWPGEGEEIPVRLSRKRF